MTEGQGPQQPATGPAGGGDVVQMPLYVCHKEVHALKIAAVKGTSKQGEEWDGTMLLEFEEEGYGDLLVTKEWAAKHEPKAGGYYVVYEDGYASWSPAQAFEGGYKRVDATA